MSICILNVISLSLVAFSTTIGRFGVVFAVAAGFVSTPEEERYLNSEEGAGSMAKGIYRAFLNYKREHELRLTGVSKTNLPTEQEEDNAPKIAQKDTESINTAPQQQELLADSRKA